MYLYSTMERSTGKHLCVVFEAQTANLAAIRCFVMAAAEAADFPREAVDAMIQAVDEAATNVILHGYRGSPGIIEVELKVDGNALVVRLRDDAPAFDPTSVPAPNLDIPLPLRPPGGLGVYLMRQFVDRVSYRRTETGRNELTLEILAPALSRDPGDRFGSRDPGRSSASADGVGRTT
jgi:serine/threonine-protein kinase RsbW